MSAKKKHKHQSNTPRRWRMKRQQRLQVAKSWLPTYAGQNIVTGYVNWFHVSRLCALLELRTLGVAITDEQIAVVRRHEERCAEKHRQQKEQQELRKQEFSEFGVYGLDYDDHFAYIAGFTSWGFAYGITWEEWNAVETDAPSVESPATLPDIEDPFANIEDPFASIEDPFAEIEDPFA